MIRNTGGESPVERDSPRRCWVAVDEAARVGNVCLYIAFSGCSRSLVISLSEINGGTYVL